VFKAVYALDENGKRIALSFFDESAKPVESAWQIHRYEWRHHNGKVYEKRFNLNNEQQPIRPEFKFYEVELTYDSDNKLTFVKNLGLNGSPTNNDSGASIDRIIYDQHGNFTRWQVYSKDGNPVEGNRKAFSWGAFEHKSTYYPNGNQKSHQIFDEKGQLSRHLLLEYNQAQSHISWLKSLDENNQLTASPMLGGAAALKYEYLDDGSRSPTLFNSDLSEFKAPKTKTGE
jgi:hypothetical protein